MNSQPAVAALFGNHELDRLTAAAQSSARRRKNLNFHASAGAPAQRLLNAVEPDSYVQPHRHLAPHKDETMVVLRGAFGLVFFDEAGRVTDTAVIAAQGNAIGATVARGLFHSVVSLEPGSVFFECKAGPYDAATDKQAAPWAPAEDNAAAPAYHAALRALFEAAA